MASPARTLVLFAHPALERSRINMALKTVAEDAPAATFRDLYELYPDFAIDVDEEQRLLSNHDLIVLQFPFYWYSAPALMKEWMDLVLEHGFAYGEHGHALDGKSLACAITTGGMQQAYSTGDKQRYGLADFLRPLEQTAALCRMRWAEPFSVHGAAVCAPVRLDQEVERYRDYLARQAADAVDWAAA